MVSEEEKYKKAVEVFFNKHKNGLPNILYCRFPAQFRKSSVDDYPPSVLKYFNERNFSKKDIEEEYSEPKKNIKYYLKWVVGISFVSFFIISLIVGAITTVYGIYTFIKYIFFT